MSLSSDILKLPISFWVVAIRGLKESFEPFNCKFLDEKVKRVNKFEKKEEYERCVMCGRLTDVPTSMPIDWRENYEVGIGQFCYECVKKIQEDNQEDSLSYEQILIAVEQSRKENEK